MRTARVLVEQEPRQKGPAAKREAVDFRAAVRAQLAGVPGWPRPRADLAVDLTFTTTSRQPPGLAKLPKNYLDLLGATNAPNGDPGAILYNDDGAIGMLFASAHNIWIPGSSLRSPSIYVVGRTRSDALADMALVHDILLDDGPPVRTAQLLGPDDDLFDRDNDDTIAWLRSLADKQSLNTAALLEHHDRQQQQWQLLARNDSWLTEILLGSGHLLLTGDDPEDRRLRRAYELTNDGASTATGIASILELRENVEYRDQLLNSLGAVTLPPLPRSAGDGIDFKRELETILADYVTRRPGLFPLTEPLRITALVIPPDRNAHSTKDLDNIVIDVLGSVDRHFKPPADPTVLRPPDTALDRATALGRRVAALRDQSRDRMRSIGETAIWSYQVVELARHADDPPEGMLYLVLGHGMNMRSIWDEASNYLTDYFSHST